MLLLWLSWLACTPPEAPPTPPVQPPTLSCHFRLEPDPPQLGELFTATVELFRDDLPLEDAEVRIDATMPDHGHGMLTSPRTRKIEAGRYRADGMKLHMAGAWELVARVRDAQGEHTCRQPWDQPILSTP